MSGYFKQLMGIIVLLALGVFIGMEIATVGIDRVYGPTDAQRKVSTATTSWPAGEHELTDESESTWSEPQLQLQKPAIQSKRADQQRNTVDKIVRGNDNRSVSPLLPPVEDAPVNQLADETAGLLQRFSQAGIRTVVGLFSGLF